MKSLYETSDFDSPLPARAQRREARRVTRSEKGCVVVSRESNEVVGAAPIDKLVDATGAGDLFAAGFLVGLARGQDHRRPHSSARSRPRK